MPASAPTVPPTSQQSAVSSEQSAERKIYPKEVKDLVTEGAKLAAILEPFGKDIRRLDEIKDLLRQAVGTITTTTTLEGEKDAIAVLEPVKDGVARSVPEEKMKTVNGLVPEPQRLALFRFSPVKDFELTALKCLTRRTVEKLMGLLRVPSSPRVKFSGGRVPLIAEEQK